MRQDTSILEKSMSTDLIASAAIPGTFTLVSLTLVSLYTIDIGPKSTSAPVSASNLYTLVDSEEAIPLSRSSGCSGSVLSSDSAPELSGLLELSGLSGLSELSELSELSGNSLFAIVDNSDGISSPKWLVKVLAASLTA